MIKLKWFLRKNGIGKVCRKFILYVVLTNRMKLRKQNLRYMNLNKHKKTHRNLRLERWVFQVF
jgi:hypothetical protein